eukprot:765903-Hanusia_phi.AAC.3
MLGLLDSDIHWFGLFLVENPHTPTAPACRGSCPYQQSSAPHVLSQDDSIVDVPGIDKQLFLRNPNLVLALTKR